MERLTHHGVQERQDALLSDRIAACIVAQHLDLRPARRTRPRIGVLASRGYLHDGGWPVYGGDAPTVHAILEAGGCPCLIPALPVIEGYNPFQLLTDDPAFEEFFHLLWPLVRDLDGVIFTGGGDLYSCLYQQSPHPQAESPEMWRDIWERYLALLAWILCIPTLGICRGMQLMNVVLGGTLYQDLQAQWPKERLPLLRHRARGRLSASNWTTHPIQLHRPASRLARAVKEQGELDRQYLDAVLSMHHQAVETLAPGLEVSASSPEGVIEALEDAATCRWWVAVQFHPEWMTHLAWVRRLFTALVEESRAYAALPREELESFFDEIAGWLRQQDRTLLGRSASSLLPAEMHSSRHSASPPLSIGRWI